jgi:hypothetical protein
MQVPSTLFTLIERAFNTTAYYASRAVLPPSTCSEEVLRFWARVPVLTRNDLQHESFRLWSNAADLKSCRYVRTSGTTGQPVTVLMDDRAKNMDTAVFASHVDRVLESAAWRQRTMYHLVLHAGAFSRTMPSPGGGSAAAVKWNLINLWQAGDRSFFSALECLSGSVVTAMPSVIELICRRIVDGQVKSIRPRLIVLSGEAVTEEVIKLARLAFQCPVTSFYTMAEVGIVAWACNTGISYHVEDRNVYLEILRGGGEAAAGTEGDIVVTPLNNQAMPILRYRTGDRGKWLPEGCGCPSSTPRLLLTQGRRAARLTTASGATVNAVRFAKILGNLAIDLFDIQTPAPGLAIVSYAASQPLDRASIHVVRSAIRSSLGPCAEIRISRVSEPGKRAVPEVALAGESKAEPRGPDIEECSAWLKAELADYPGLDVALLMGSFLDPDMTTRYSDIDLMLFVQQPADARWIECARKLKGSHTRLNVVIDSVRGFSRRAPMLTCRIIADRAVLIGDDILKRLRWPTATALRAESGFWAQQTAAILCQRMAGMQPTALNSVVESWMTAKNALDALRYRYLIRGHRSASSRSVLERATADSELNADVVASVIETVDLAREHRPPPRDERETVARGCLAALHLVRLLQAEGRLVSK